MIITNAHIITMNPQAPRARAVAVADGRIVAVGSASQVDSWRSAGTEVVDLGGRVLGPGFVEPHSHLLLMGLLLGPQVIDIRSFVEPTWTDAEFKIKEAIAAAPAGRPVLVFGLDTIAHDTPMPTIEQMDGLTADHPLVISSQSAHTVSANSAAFALAGITAESDDPPGGRWGRRANGSLDGVVHEATAVAILVLPMLGAMGFDPVASVRYQAGVLAAAGFTTIGELLVQDHDRPLLAAMEHMPDFPLRMRLYEGTNASLRASGVGDPDNAKIRQVGLKLWVDGSPLEGKTLHYEPYLDTEVTRRMGIEAPCCGSANYTEEQLLAIARAYVDSGFQFACHVQGDAAVDRMLNVYETVLTERGLLGSDHRWRLEHCGAMTAEQFARATRLGVTCSMFVQHVHYFGDYYVDYIFGEERGSHWMRLKSAVDAGVRISLHNDGYFTPPVPILNMQTAVTRVTKSGRALGTDECINLDTAYRAVTIDAAWHLLSDHEVGSIEVGKFADFAELSADPYQCDPVNLADQVTVLGTWLNGKKVDPDALMTP